jgi:N-acetyl-alpha-D-muramate 1-phosphate uridylyltransferase
MKAMVLAAGLGTRLHPFTLHHPKALAVVNNKTLLEHSIRYLQFFGIYDVVVNVHHFADQIIDVLEAHEGFGSTVAISDETDQVLETGGGILKAIGHFEQESSFVALNVDVLTNLDLGKMIEAHNAQSPMATLAVMKRASSRQLLFDDSMNLCGWEDVKKMERRISRECTFMQPFAFSGVQVLSPEMFKDIPFSGKFSIIDLYLHQSRQQAIQGYDHSGNIFIDVGKPESLEQAQYLFS